MNTQLSLSVFMALATLSYGYTMYQNGLKPPQPHHHSPEQRQYKKYHVHHKYQGGELPLPNKHGGDLQKHNMGDFSHQKRVGYNVHHQPPNNQYTRRFGSFGQIEGHKYIQPQAQGSQLVEKVDQQVQPLLEHHEKKHDLDYHDPHPKYKFEYGVHDSHTGDYKSHKEERDGDSVHGSYELMEPGGGKRVVHYTSDKHRGFVAVVHREHTIHEQPTHHEQPTYHEQLTHQEMPSHQESLQQYGHFEHPVHEEEDNQQGYRPQKQLGHQEYPVQEQMDHQQFPTMKHDFHQGYSATQEQPQHYEERERYSGTQEQPQHYEEREGYSATQEQPQHYEQRGYTN